MRRLELAIVVSFSFASTSVLLCSQTRAGDQAYRATMTFDVASVRQSPVADSYLVTGGFSGRSTHLNVTNFSLENLLRVAYGYDFYRFEGIPDSFQQAMFNVEAHGDSDADLRLALLTPAQMTAERQHMMQALLAERFALRAHWETREAPVVRIVAPHGEQKLRRSAALAEGETASPPLIQRNDPAGGYDFIGRRCSMAQLMQMLGGQFGRPVEDATGLSGEYDFFLPYDRVWESDRPDDDPRRPPPLERSLKEALGLKVESVKGSVRVLVIDHVEMPTAN